MTTTHEKRFQIEGKDYLTQDEAAHYLGVSETKFREIKKQFDLQPYRMKWGKLLYPKSELMQLIEDCKQ